jgi:solute carrier family 7 (L-type amino acid transporter), member 9/15
VSAPGALCYAEIGGIIPRNGAEVAYMKEGWYERTKIKRSFEPIRSGIGSVHQRTGEVLAYLFSWTTTFILKPSSLAALTLTFSQYFLAGILSGKMDPIDSDIAPRFL